MKKLLLFAITLFTLSFLSVNSRAQCDNPPGNPTEYGDHAWNLYAFNTGDVSWFGNESPQIDSYAGYYVDSSLDFHSSWMNYPSDVPGYSGCSINSYHFSWSANRRGFKCGVYTLTLVDYFCGGQIFVNGLKVWEGSFYEGIGPVWSGVLDDSSTVVFRVTTPINFSTGQLNVDRIGVAVSGPPTFCPGVTVHLTAPSAPSYLWSTGETTQTISVTESSNYTVAYSQGTCDIIDTQQVTFATLDTPVFSIFPGNNICDAGLVNIDVANYAYNLSYNWNSEDVFFDDYGKYVTYNKGNYELTVDDMTSGCSSIAHLTINGPPGTSADYGKNIWDVIAYRTNKADPTVYAGFYRDSTLNFDSQSAWDPISNPSSATGYQGCTIGDDKIAWSAQRQGFPCGVYQVDVLNHDDSAALIIDGVQVWQSESASSSPQMNVWTGALTSATEIKFRNINHFNESTGALQFTIVGGTAPLITVSGHPVVCTGQFKTLTSIAGASYQWTNGETTNPAHATETGLYAVTVTDSTGCSVSSDPVSIVVLPDIAPDAHITASAPTICDWNPVTLTSASAMDNIWSTNETTQSISVTVASDYYLAVTNAAGCYDEDVIHIGVGYTPPTPVASNEGPYCPNSPANLTASGLAPGGQVGEFLDFDQFISSGTLPNTNFTIEMWVKTTTSIGGLFSAASGNLSLFSKSLYIYNGQLLTYLDPAYIWNTGFIISDGNWHHIAWVLQAGVGQSMFVDGFLVGTNSSLDHSSLNLNYMTIGYTPETDFLYLHGGLDGLIDNLRIWNDVRTQEEIRSNMLYETPLSSANLIYHFPFNGNDNTVVGTSSAIGGSGFADADFYTFSWTGSGAPEPSTSGTQTTSSLTQSETFSVMASVGGCGFSPSASTNVTISPTVTFYLDGDGDGYGSDPYPGAASCESPAPYYVKNNSDCNDFNNTIHPNAIETCNSLDDNCNGQVDEGTGITYYADADGDGFGDPNAFIQSCVTPPHYVSNSNDCNDTKSAVHPGVLDICNKIDDNCDGITDENAFDITISPAGTVTTCSGTAVTLTANGGSGLYYAWLRNGVTIDGATSSTYTTNKKGKYTVTASNLICFDASPTTLVAVNTLPSATISHTGSLDLCVAGSVTLQANSGSGLKYQWMKGLITITGATNQTYVVTKKGTYKVIVTNSTNCSKTSAAVKVTKNCKVGEDGDEGEELVSGNLFIYPNPTSGRFILQLELDGTEGEAVLIMMHNEVGQVVYKREETTVDGKLNLEIDPEAGLPGGVYFVRAIAGQEQFTQKIVLQR